MAALSDLTAWRDALLGALATGALSVTGGGISTTFRSIADLEAALARVDREIRAAGGGARRITSIEIVTPSRGW